MWQELEVGAWVASRKQSMEDVRAQVQEIIGRVRAEGDAALRALSRHVKLEEIAVTDEEREAAYTEVDPEVTEALVEAEARITRFHELQRPRDLWLQEVEPGIILGMKTTPLDRVGIYVPGGRAPYPSSALMCAVPAKVAGVQEICACSPPPISPLTLVALDIAGVTEIYRSGGAQAVAAMAVGTETIPRVQKIVGPGNVFVTMAKVLLRRRWRSTFRPALARLGSSRTGPPTPLSSRGTSSPKPNMIRGLLVSSLLPTGPLQRRWESRWKSSSGRSPGGTSSRRLSGTAVMSS